MIIRELRNNEKYKRDMLFSVSFGMKADIEKSKTEEMNLIDEVFIGAFCDDDETLMAQVAVITYKSMYYGNIMTASGIAGVSTLPEYRRLGCIREIFKYIFDSDKMQKWDTSLLYPFSFRYYRKFGFERILQHKTIKVPFSALAVIPRNDKGVLYQSKDQLPELLELYNNFGKKFNAFFYREGGKYFNETPFKSGKYTYIWYDGGKPRAYATGIVEGRTLNVSELVWLDKEALIGIIGFLRMFEGQLDDIFFSTLDKNNPLDLLIDCDRSTSFGMYDGAMGRAVDIKKCLSLYPFPGEEGSVVIEVTEDFIKENNGFYHVKFGNGVVKVSHKKTGKPDISISICSLSRLLFGETEQKSIEYLPETVIHTDKEKIKNIFKPTDVNLFERF
ncbi:MAG TPA: hypothetical protein DCP51_03365 [Clostridiales bacterium]|nr:MAG: hypothetical protein A2Y40_06345 [Candidatus Margulisbacteria bacterium GWF2_35_9]HAN20704.1 hypothetical protein [Clostridiales bacterium]